MGIEALAEQKARHARKRRNKLLLAGGAVAATAAAAVIAVVALHRDAAPADLGYAPPPEPPRLQR
jgi:hypothetical protein